MILVSACLLGVKCRYDGTRRMIPEKIQSLIDSGEKLVPVCPEQLGGLSTPRVKSKVVWNGDLPTVTNDQGDDVTTHFIQGAEEALRLARLLGATQAYLKSKSPSCGRQGVAMKLLSQNGIKVTILDSPLNSQSI